MKPCAVAVTAHHVRRQSGFHECFAIGTDPLVTVVGAHVGSSSEPGF
jgi:hypothetical protein